MADSKLSALTAATPIVTDEVYLLDDPGGTPLSKKATVQGIIDLVPSASTTVAGISELATSAEITAGTGTLALSVAQFAGVTDLTNQSWFLDDDTFAGDDATKVASQQSIKAYVAANSGGTPTLQDVYDNSAAGKTTLDATRTELKVVSRANSTIMMAFRDPTDTKNYMTISDAGTTNGANITITRAAGDTAWSMSGAGSSFLSHFGDLGIGTNSPQYGLDIGKATRFQTSIGFFNTAPIAQITTGVAEATYVENSGGAVVNVDSTFGGYTVQQIAQALQNYGLLA